jgi:hypothetical protein
MLNINFEGWFQLRMATDPDPPDDPRGMSGPTQAVAGEPDFDGIIRFNDYVAPRYPMDREPGVRVSQVSLDTTVVPDHPLLFGRVDLLDSPRFEGRNFVIAVGGKEPIDPFHIRVSSADGSASISRADLWNPAEPDLRAIQVTPAQLVRRQPVSVSLQSAEVAEATGILDYLEYRKSRLELLQEKLKESKDPTEMTALGQRIRCLENDETMTGVTEFSRMCLGVQEFFNIGPNAAPLIGPGLNGPIVMSDPNGRLGGKIGTAQPWPCTFWMGGFDVDTMMGYVSGTLSIPFRPNS